MTMQLGARGAAKPHQARGRLSPPSRDLERAKLDDLEKREFYEGMPSLPIPLDRGRVAKRWMPAGARVLDIGCSAGYHVRHLARKSSRVAAIDVDHVSLKVARRRVRSSRVTFLRYDGYRLPFADASFDVVTMLDVLEHVADRQAIVAEITRVLRPGGTWIVSVPYRGAVRWLSPENMAQDYPRLFRFISRLTNIRFWVRGHNATQTRHTHFNRNDLTKLASAGFKPVRAARRGSLLYALAYLAICFPLPLLGRLWASLCFALMALDYQIPYGPCAYNLIMQFRRLSVSRMDSSESGIAFRTSNLADVDRAVPCAVVA